MNGKQLLLILIFANFCQFTLAASFLDTAGYVIFQFFRLPIKFFFGGSNDKVPLTMLTIQPADRILCDSSIFNPITHNLLATENNKLVYLNITDPAKAIITEVTLKEYFDSGHSEYKCTNDGQGKLGREESLKNVRKWIGKEVYHDFIRCNCQHWVNYWTNGEAGRSKDSFRKTNSECAIH